MRAVFCDWVTQLYAYIFYHKYFILLQVANITLIKAMSETIKKRFVKTPKCTKRLTFEFICSVSLLRASNARSRKMLALRDFRPCGSVLRNFELFGRCHARLVALEHYFMYAKCHKNGSSNIYYAGWRIKLWMFLFDIHPFFFVDSLLQSIQNSIRPLCCFKVNCAISIAIF